LLGTIKQSTGSFGLGFALFAAVTACGLVALLALRQNWRRSWPRESVIRAGLAPIEPDVVAAGD
jgi:hypothetical protein